MDSLGQLVIQGGILHVDFGTPQFINPPVGNLVTRNVAVTDELFRVGVNYRILGGGSVTSRY